MNVAQTIPLADGFGMHNGNGGWWILGAAVMMLSMGGMMWMMMRGMGGGSAASSAPPERPAIKESPVEIVDRRFAQGEISVEDYRTRREMLVNRTPESNGAQKDEAFTAAGAGQEQQ